MRDRAGLAGRAGSHCTWASCFGAPSSRILNLLLGNCGPRARRGCFLRAATTFIPCFHLDWEVLGGQAGWRAGPGSLRSSLSHPPPPLSLPPRPLPSSRKPINRPPSDQSLSVCWLGLGVGEEWVLVLKTTRESWMYKQVLLHLPRPLIFPLANICM